MLRGKLEATSHRQLRQVVANFDRTLAKSIILVPERGVEDLGKWIYLGHDTSITVDAAANDSEPEVMALIRELEALVAEAKVCA